MYATNWLDEDELNVLDVTQRNIKTMTANATSTLTTSPIARLLVMSDDEQVLKISTQPGVSGVIKIYFLTITITQPYYEYINLSIFHTIQSHNKR